MNGDTGTQQAPEGGNWQFKEETSPVAPVSPSPQPANPTPASTPPSTSPVAVPPATVPPQPSPVAATPETPPLQPTEIIGAEYAEPQSPVPNYGEISWTASEFTEHEKTPLWYIGLGVVTLVLAVIVHLLTKDIISIVALVAFAIAFGVIGSYKPKIVAYHIGPEGIQVNHRNHHFSQFKSYALQREGAFPSIVFIPMQRFMPPTVVYFPPDEGDRVLDVLSHYLPAGTVSQDPLDRLLRRIRF